MSEHYLLGHGISVLIMEDKERLCLHIDALHTISILLQSIVEINEAKLCNQVAICLAKFDRKAAGLYRHLESFLFELFRGLMEGVV